MLKFRCLVLYLLVTAAVPGATIVADPNPIVSTNAVKDAITGADMAGLIVTATYTLVGGSTITHTMTWVATGPTSGRAAFPLGPNFAISVSLTGDTSGNLAWQYSTIFLDPLLSLTFDGTAAGIYFDRTLPDPGTPGSGPGADIVFGPFIPPMGFTVPLPNTVRYSSAVALDGNPPAGDLYAKMEIDFGPGTVGASDFAFTQDTDAAIPEPASALLVFSGIGLLACALCFQKFSFSRYWKLSLNETTGSPGVWSCSTK